MTNDNSSSVAGAAVGTALTIGIIAAAVGMFLHVMGGVLTP